MCPWVLPQILTQNFETKKSGAGFTHTQNLNVTIALVKQVKSLSADIHLTILLRLQVMNKE